MPVVVVATRLSVVVLAAASAREGVEMMDRRMVGDTMSNSLSRGNPVKQSVSEHKVPIDDESRSDLWTDKRARQARFREQV